MGTTIHRHAGLTILEMPAQGAPLHADDIIGDAVAQDVTWVALPVSRAPDDFFRLRSGVLGEFTQKFINYGLRLAVIDDVSKHIEASEAFRAYVIEANRSRHLRFAETINDLLEQIGVGRG